GATAPHRRRGKRAAAPRNARSRESLGWWPRPSPAPSAIVFGESRPSLDCYHGGRGILTRLQGFTQADPTEGRAFDVPARQPHTPPPPLGFPMARGPTPP